MSTKNTKGTDLPSQVELMKELAAYKQQAIQLHELNATLKAQAVNKVIKVSPPEKFTGRSSNLKSWITQVRVYIAFNKGSFNEPEDQVMAASLLLGGEAASWFEPKVRDFIENEHKNRDSDI